MPPLILGLHHVTVPSSDPQANFNFYAGILGLKLVKKTVNFDAPEVYHLYYGNDVGTPGTLLTFFPFSGIPQGRKGNGQVTTISLSIAESSVSYWLQRLTKYNVKYDLPQKSFKSELSIAFEDHEGLGLELVANTKDKRIGHDNKIIPIENAIKGLYGVTLSEKSMDRTEELLINQLDYELLGEKDNRYRFIVKGNEFQFVDILHKPDDQNGIEGSGTVHHVAFATENKHTQLMAQKKLQETGLYTTPVINREYFYSVYFREPGGVLFEVATLPPGFTIDESVETLGMHLKLPPWEETRRQDLESILPPINTDITRFID